MSTLKSRTQSEIERGMRVLGQIKRDGYSHQKQKALLSINQALKEAAKPLKLMMLFDDLVDLDRDLTEIKSFDDAKSVLLPIYRWYYLLLTTDYHVDIVTADDPDLVRTSSELGADWDQRLKHHLLRTYGSTKTQYVIVSQMEFLSIDPKIAMREQALIQLRVYLVDALDPHLQAFDDLEAQTLGLDNQA